MRSTENQPLLPRTDSLVIWAPFICLLNGGVCGTFYGLNTILGTYLNSRLKFDQKSAGALTNGFLALNYSFALVGGIIADGWLGQFKTLISASILVIFGLLVMISGTLFHRYEQTLLVPMVLVGIVMFFMGNGIGKPCLSTFLGDQFKPNEAEARSSYFSYFYLCIQVGSLAFSIGVPFALQYFPYSLTYTVFLIIMAPLLIALTIFLIPSGNYNKKKPGGNVFFKFLRIVALGCCGDYTEPNSKHWLDKAKRKFTHNEVEDAKAVLRVLLIFIPLPFFWAVFFQMYSVWVFQAQKMDTKIAGFSIPPATTSAINGILDILLIPLFDKVIYPLCEKCFKFSLLRRIGAGHIFTIAALLVAGFTSLSIEPVQCTTPDKGQTFVCPSNAVHIAWIVPQYILISCAEILLSISGLDFAYQEAPATMKGSITAIFLATTAVGNAMITVLTLINVSDALKDFIFAGIIFIVFIIFTVIAYFYRYRVEEEASPLSINGADEGEGEGSDLKGYDQ